MLLVDLTDDPSDMAAVAAAHDAGLPVVALVDDDAPHLASGSRCHAYLSLSVAPLTLATVLHEACEWARVDMEARQMSKQLRDLNEIGIRLSAERDSDTLLALILSKAREITRSDAGSLYVVEPQPGAGPHLRFKLAQNDTIRVALREATLPISADTSWLRWRSPARCTIDDARSFARALADGCSFDVRTGTDGDHDGVPRRPRGARSYGVRNSSTANSWRGEVASLEASRYEVCIPSVQEMAASLGRHKTP